MQSRSRRLFARVAVVALAAASLTVLAAPVGAGGPDPGVFPVPAGTTVTFQSPYLNACNALEWGYQIDDQSPVVVDQFAGGCTNQTFPSTTIGPFAGPVTLRVFLTDVSCGATYFSDGTPVDHATVLGSGPWEVWILDAQIAPTCANKNVSVEPTEGGNLEVGISIDPVLTVKKVVAGDDPGIAFPIDVACSAAGRIPASVEAAAEPEIVLDDPGDSDATTVALKNGESTNVPLALGSGYITSVTCTVSESLAGVTLPEGFTCAAPVVDRPTVVWENGEWSATPVTVTNTCSKVTPVVVQPNFTG